jgi:hypothetical protein
MNRKLYVLLGVLVVAGLGFAIYRSQPSDVPQNVCRQGKCQPVSQGSSSPGRDIGSAAKPDAAKPETARPETANNRPEANGQGGTNSPAPTPADNDAASARAGNAAGTAAASAAPLPRAGAGSTLAVFISASLLFGILRHAYTIKHYKTSNL